MHIFVLQTIRNSILRFIPATKSSSGSYTCKASNSKGISYKTVNVVVVSNPSWREKPSDVSVAIGQPFELAATFYSSDSRLTSWWFKGNVKLTTSVQHRKIVGENVRMILFIFFNRHFSLHFWDFSNLVKLLCYTPLKLKYSPRIVIVFT